VGEDRRGGSGGRVGRRECDKETLYSVSSCPLAGVFLLSMGSKIRDEGAGWWAGSENVSIK